MAAWRPNEIIVHENARCDPVTTIAFVTKPSSVARFLRHLGEPTEAPPMALARDPPYYKTRAVRRTLGELDPPPSEDRTQGGLF